MKNFKKREVIVLRDHRVYIECEINQDGLSARAFEIVGITEPDGEYVFFERGTMTAGITSTAAAEPYVDIGIRNDGKAGADFGSDGHIDIDGLPGFAKLSATMRAIYHYAAANLPGFVDEDAEKAEDVHDLAMIAAARAEGGPEIPWTTIKAEMGIG